MKTLGIQDSDKLKKTSKSLFNPEQESKGPLNKFFSQCGEKAFAIYFASVLMIFTVLIAWSLIYQSAQG